MSGEEERIGTWGCKRALGGAVERAAMEGINVS